ncbi:unnamed protein product [Dibothriocephalus latus]|uniref:Uncharacterized protein n=1 Tax=Dibothriocephalus latus TaxID=60516 RepID=A0A3P7P2D4_DIBLA|nr:unnamed protein product [Dibothriocephalus latus]
MLVTTRPALLSITKLDFAQSYRRMERVATGSLESLRDGYGSASALGTTSGSQRWEIGASWDPQVGFLTLIAQYFGSTVYQLLLSGLSIHPLEVFETSRMAQHCDSCLALPARFHAGWCLPDDVLSAGLCITREKCLREGQPGSLWLQSPETCPDPQILSKCAIGHVW